MIVVQFFWIRNAFTVKEAMFNRSVNDALGNVVRKMETRENMFFISRNFEGDSILQIVKAFSKDTSRNFQRRYDSLMALSEVPMLNRHPPPPRMPPLYPGHNHGTLHYSYQLNIVPGSFSNDSVIVDLEKFNEIMQVPDFSNFTFHWEDQMALLDSMMESGNNMDVVHGQFPPYRPEPGGPDKKMSREDHIRKLENKARKIQELIKQMAIAIETKPAPIQQRINKASLQASLSKSLNDKGIDLPFEFAVFSPSNAKNPFPIRSRGFEKDFQSTEHRISLFPNDLFQKPDLLLVHFYGQKALVFKSLSWLLASSILFTLIIVLSSGASIVVMIRQKKISDIKTDFINNMTHEFKTPIATISIAADSINNPRVISEPDTIKNFTKIIKEENNRMNTRVEQVLQMALLDSRDFRLRPGLVNMNTLIERVVDHFKLQIEKRNGTVVVNLEAANAEILVDEDHIRNVLINLLDNANKYSISNPEITVFSSNRAGKYLFGVKDKGIGMTAEAQHKVFDKFFRVTSGNIHNIKGFGLGLSYVKAITLAHHGEINIESEPGKGSTFEISLPTLKK